MSDDEPAARRLLALLDAVDIPLIAADLVGRINFWNRGAERLFGFRADEVLGRDCAILDGKGFCDRLRQYAIEPTTEQELYFDDAIGRTKGGRLFPMRALLAPMRDRHHRRIGVSCLLDDITNQRATEYSLRDSQERLTMAVDAGNLGVWDWHLPCGHLAVNNVLNRMLGRVDAPGRISARKLFLTVHPDDRAMLETALNTSGTYTVEFRLRKESGVWIWVASRGRVLERGADGRPIRVLGIVQDVTFRKTVERERSMTLLRVELLNRLANQREESTDALLQSIVDGAARLTDSRLGFLGLLSHETAGPRVEIWREHGTGGRLAAEFRSLLQTDAGTLLEEVLLRREAVVHNRWGLDPHEDADGKPTPDETDTRDDRLHRVLAAPVLDRGNVVAIAAVANKSTDYDEHDIQELATLAQAAWHTLQRREDELRERRMLERLAHVNLLQDDLLLPAPIEWKLRKLSDAAVALLRLTFCRIWIVVPDDDCDPACRHAADRARGLCCQTGRCLQLMASSGRFPRQSGRYRRVPIDSLDPARVGADPRGGPILAEPEWARRLALRASIALPLVNEKNEVVGALGAFGRKPLGAEETAFLDSLARTGSHVLINHIAHERLREARAAAETANAAKSAFLANMSHEIRTPLTAILGFADVLLEMGHCDESRQAAETIVRNSKFLLSMINDILDLSKVEANHLPICLTPTDLPRLLRETCALMALRARRKQLDLRLEIQGPLPPRIQTDPVRLKQVLLNLLGNAIRFTDQGAVRLRAAFQTTGERLGALRLDVIDTGIGIASDDLSRLFRPFVQLEGDAARRRGGTGLGLAIARELVQRLGGSIGIESRRGVGSTFTVRIPNVATDAPLLLELVTSAATTIPTAAENPEEEEEANRPLPTADALDGLHILVAEDGPDNQRLIARLLQKAGAVVELAADGQEAIERAMRQDTAFDCILMDMQMPRRDGYSATRRLRAAGVRTPIVALTACAMAGDRQKCLDAGCNDYLSKPIDRHRLVAAIRQNALGAAASASGPPQGASPAQTPTLRPTDSISSAAP